MAKLTLLVVAAAVLVAAASAATIETVTCQDALTTLMPCMDFLKGHGPGTPSAPCCEGVQNLNRECALRPDRVTVCQCLKDAAPGFGVDPDRTKDLPGLCSVHLPFQIVHDVDCSKISY